MATRFGAFSPAQTYAAKVRWLVGCLLAVISVLVLTLFYIARDGNNSASIPPDAVAKVDTALSPTVDILIASQRIEEGAQIQEFMLGTQPVPTERIPDGALRAHEKQLIIGRYTNSILNANIPITREFVTDSKPVDMLNIPPGYRAVTIEVGARSGVEGWAKPNSRVDILWTYTDKDNQRKVATIVRFTKVLSVAGATKATKGAAVGQNRQTTVTIQVTERDAKKIELARTLGSLSLSLVGAQEEVKLNGEETDIVDIDSILGTKSTVEEQDEPADGTMYAIDPKTGKRIRYLLKGKRWVRDPNF